MNNKEVNAIRDAALAIQNVNVFFAYKLMLIASKERPNGKLIKQKVNEYKKILDVRKKAKQIMFHMISSGELAIIPTGFRCYTKQMLKGKLGITQPSLPFDSGFFTHQSIVRIMDCGEINFAHSDSGPDGYSVCIKQANCLDEFNNKYIKFTPSSYDYIDTKVSQSDVISNNYLDSTGGYYTLDINNEFVLAHYNWHASAPLEKSKGIITPEDNIPLIKDLMNNRLRRLEHMCHSARKIIFVTHDHQGYDYVQIGSSNIPIANIELLRDFMNFKFGEDKVYIERLSDIDNHSKLMGVLGL